MGKEKEFLDFLYGRRQVQLGLIRSFCAWLRGSPSRTTKSTLHVLEFGSIPE